MLRLQFLDAQSLAGSVVREAQVAGWLADYCGGVRIGWAFGRLRRQKTVAALWIAADKAEKHPYLATVMNERTAALVEGNVPSGLGLR